MRREYCEMDGISITYTDTDVCFEDMETAEAILIFNGGDIRINNFGRERTAFFMDWYNKIYHTIVHFRTMDRLEEMS